MSEQATPVPVAHVDDPASTARLAETLETIHGPPYEFAVRRWDGSTALAADPERTTVHVVITAADAETTVAAGDSVRGPPPEQSYEENGDRHPTAAEAHTAAVRPGDVVVLQPGTDPVDMTGTGATFEVRTEATAYPAPRFGFLRNVPDEPAGCAQYERAFRREVLPPDVSEREGDARGTNRLNNHTLDMRHDREPQPVQHCHGPVSAGADGTVDHTETAIVLDRDAYDLPPVTDSDPHVRLFRDPRGDPADYVDLPVEPGSIVVTPATRRQVYGHAFRNAFAALVAVPGFSAPLVEIGDDAERQGDSHRKYHQ